MSLRTDARMYWRFVTGLPWFLRRRISVDEAWATFEHRLERREHNFLRLLEKGVYGHPRSPYLPLLRAARCELGDVQRLVREAGVEGTLRALNQSGVRFTFEQFKGREPVVCEGRHLPIQSQDFDNPYLSPAYYAQSGGSTGAGTRVPIDLDHMLEIGSQDLLMYDVHGLLGVSSALCYPAYPAGFSGVLQRVPTGQVPKKWFSPTASGDFNVPWRHRLAMAYVVGMSRLMGAAIPSPELVRLDQMAVVARWVAKTIEAEGRAIVRGHVSTAVRVVVAAASEGLSLSGAAFVGGGEPPTPAKVATILRSGARWVPSYVFTEVGRVGFGCGNPVDGNDVHFLKDRLALIQRSRVVPGTDVTVDAFLFTTLSPAAPKLLLNVESDDYGIIERRSCGCALEKRGLTEHIRGIHSFRKLTGEGVTLVGGEIVRILEEVLPARLGGTSLDYQLHEEEDATGLTRLSLVISPRIAIADERSVIDIVQQELAASSMAADSARAIWSQAGTWRVKRMEPVATARGKLMPLHLVRHATASAAAPREG
jgi:hypothetical protein